MSGRATRPLGLPIPRIERKRNWDIPSFDFGHLLDLSHPDNLLADLSRRQLHPRKQDIAIAFTRSGEPWILISRWGTREQPDDDDWSPRLWLYRRISDGSWENADSELLVLEYIYWCAEWLLQNPVRIEAVAGPRMRCPRSGLNGPRSIRGPTVIRLIQPVYPASGLHGTGSPRRPHDRRGHLRRYRSGKSVWVKASKIRGGAATGTEYRVRP